MKEANIGKGVLLIIGAIYALLGGIFVTLGIVFLFSIKGEPMMGLIFSGIGSIFLILGIIFLYIEHRKKQIANELIARGNYITGVVVDFVRNHQIRVNGRCPFILMVKYIDGNGTSHIFKSRNVFHYPDQSVIGKQVKIYIEDDSYKHYYVDIDEVLTKVIEH